MFEKKSAFFFFPFFFIFFFFSLNPLVRAVREKIKQKNWFVASSKSRRREASERVDSYQNWLFKAPSCLEHHTEQDCPYPLGAAGGISRARTMLLDVGREGGNSFRNRDSAREVASTKSDNFSRTRIPPPNSTNFHTDANEFSLAKVA